MFYFLPKAMLLINLSGKMDDIARHLRSSKAATALYSGHSVRIFHAMTLALLILAEHQKRFQIL